MLQTILRCFATHALFTPVICLVGLFAADLAVAGQTEARGPDGTPLACNFNFRLQAGSMLQVGSDPMAASTDCDDYHIYLAKNRYDPSQGTFTISQTGSPNRLTYHVADMPLNEPLLLLDPSRQPTRVIARRRVDRIDFVVGRAQFTGPPTRALRPRTATAGAAATSGPGSRSHSTVGNPFATVPLSALIGSWRTQGLILIFRADGTFQRVSNSSFGSFGGVIGLDDAGTYTIQSDQLSITGNVVKRTCPFAVGPNTLTFCGITYSRE